MSTAKHMIGVTSIEARLKNYGVQLVASGPDYNEVGAFIPGSDIREQYGINPAAFIDQYCENENVLFELFHSVHGIAYAD